MMNVRVSTALATQTLPSYQLITPRRHALLNSFPDIPFRKHWPLPITLKDLPQPLRHISNIHQARLEARMRLNHIPSRARRQQSLARGMTDGDLMRDFCRDLRMRGKHGGVEVRGGGRHGSVGGVC